MKLIAKKPCSFGGKNFFIGNEVPVELVADPAAQEKLGVIAVAELKDDGGAFEGIVQIAVKGKSDGENEQVTAIPATPEEIQQVFAIMQLNADDGAKAVFEVKSENVLILLHAADSRKTIKDAAKKQVDVLFSTNSEGADA